MLQSLVEEREPIRMFRALRAHAQAVAPYVARLQCPDPPRPPILPDWSAGVPREPRPSRVAAATAPGEFLLDRSDGDLSACTLIGAEGLTIPVGGVSGTAPLAILSAPGVEGSVRTVAGATYAARRTFGKLGRATVAARQIGGLPPAARKYFGLCSFHPYRSLSGSRFRSVTRSPRSRRPSPGLSSQP